MTADMTRMTGMQALFGAPGIFPLAADVAGNRVLLVRRAVEDMRGLAFHDPRTMGSSEANRITVDAEPLLREAANWPRISRIIFHTAFCVSTLLSRALDRLPGVHGWREPYFLLQIVEADAGAWSTPETRAAWLDLAFRLLDRGGSLGKVVVKAHDRVLPEAAVLLASNPDLRAVALYTDLDSFLLGAIKSAARRDWTAQSAKAVINQASAREGMGRELVHAFAARLDETPAAQGAFLWLFRIAMIADTLRRVGPDRLRIFDGGRLVGSRQEMLPEISKSLELPPPPPALFDDPLWQIHAKSQDVAMDAAAHDARQTELAERFREELGVGRLVVEDLLKAAPGLSANIQSRSGRLVFDPVDLI